MAKYFVTIVLRVDVAVEARNRRDAENKAMDKWTTGKLTEELGPNWTNNFVYVEQIRQ